MAKHVKWYFNVSKWKPSKDEWLWLTSSVADEEIKRINKFVYQDDAKSSLIGRALIRFFVSHAIGRPSNELDLIRTTHGRPILSKDYIETIRRAWPKSFDFNLSHSGDFCVLTGFWSHEECLIDSVGVDVTKIVSKKTKAELERFLSLMSRREFTHGEWETVDRVTSDKQKCVNFTRLWCLKECYIKSIGLGLSFKLNRIEFKPSAATKYTLSPKMLKDKILDDTRVLLDGHLAEDWAFLETALDEDHLVAVGYKFLINDLTKHHEVLDTSPFEEVRIERLIKALTPINSQEEDNWSRFRSKDSRKP